MFIRILYCWATYASPPLLENKFSELRDASIFHQCHVLWMSLKFETLQSRNGLPQCQKGYLDSFYKSSLGISQLCVSVKAFFGWRRCGSGHLETLFKQIKTPEDLRFRKKSRTVTCVTFFSVQRFRYSNNIYSQFITFTCMHEESSEHVIAKWPVTVE